MKALSIRQAWAELILRDENTVEARSKRTSKSGERVLIYAGKNRIEPEEARIAAEYGIDEDSLPRGVLVGTVKIQGCESLEPGHSKTACYGVTESTGGYAWLQRNPQRADELRSPEGHPSLRFSRRSDQPIDALYTTASKRHSFESAPPIT